jgi:hypothetical protein
MSEVWGNGFLVHTQDGPIVTVIQSVARGLMITRYVSGAPPECVIWSCGGMLQGAELLSQHGIGVVDMIRVPENAISVEIVDIALLGLSRNPASRMRAFTSATPANVVNLFKRTS